jgi:Ca2+-dependent lipid-binding protein
MGVVTVHLEKLTHLKDNDGFGKSDSYVEFYLEKNNLVFDKGYGKQKSSIKPNDCNPEFGETFTFKDVESLEKLVLKVKVMDDDIGINDKIGSCEFNLEKLNPHADGTSIESVIDSKFLGKDAKVYLKISYSA